MERTGNSLAVGNRRYRLLPLAQIVKADWNYKKEDTELTKKLVANIKRNGQVENVLVRQLKDGRFEMVNGNHRHDAFTLLKQQRVLVCDLGKISKAAAMRIALETNETKYETDFVQLSKLMKELGSEFTDDDLLGTMPFDLRELQDIRNITEFQWPESGGKKAKGEQSANGKEEGKIQMVLNFTSKETNILNAFFTRADKKSPEAAIIWAIQHAP
jgi:hypothetical protein